MDSATKIGEVLGVDTRSKVRRGIVRWGLIAVALAALAAIVIGVLNRPKPQTARFKTETAQRGDLKVTVTATGQLEAVHQVEVGTEVSGTVQSVFADYNQRVKAGQVLVQLDLSRLKATLLQSEAAVKSAEAAVLDAEVNVRDTQNKLERYEALWRDSSGRQPSRLELDTARTARDRAVATEAANRAQLAEARARFSVDKTNLTKATIKSPIDGLVLERKVEPGQTVAASLQTPVLFVLAESLTQMELHVAVDEADVGQVREDQSATFTVDAYPSRTFPASISQVRFAPQPVEGVVTYETILLVDNTDLALRPGMTATAEIVVDHRKDVLLVPNAAMRFVPPAPEREDKRGLLGRLLPGPPRMKTQKPESDARSASQHVYTLEHDKPVQRAITVGATNGTQTEVRAGELAPGTPVIVDLLEQPNGG